MPPNHAAYDDFFTPGIARICGSSEYGSICVSDRRDEAIMRLAPVTLPPELKATRTESSMPNRKKAVITENSVRNVRVLLRNSAAQIRWKYFIASSRAGSGVVGVHGLLDQVALVEMQGVRGVLGGLGIVRDHHDRLAVLAVEHLQQAQDFLGRGAVQVARGFVADQQ